MLTLICDSCGKSEQVINERKKENSVDFPLPDGWKITKKSGFIWHFCEDCEIKP